MASVLYAMSIIWNNFSIQLILPFATSRLGLFYFSYQHTTKSLTAFT